VIARALVFAAVALVLAPAAVAATVVDEAADALRSDPVYVDPQAERALSPADERQVEQAISGADAGPIYIAVLPDAARKEAGGSAGEVLRELIAGLHRDGTYAVVVGDSFRAASNIDDDSQAEHAARQALDEHGDEGTAATLVGFVHDFADEAHGGGSGGGGFPGWGFGAIAAAVAGFFLLRRRRRRREEDAQLAAVKAEANDDLIALAEDVQALEADVDRDPRVKEDYLQALDSYERAGRALDRARRPQELEAVSSALEEGRYSMASAKARLEGREPPERRPPCFFDPRHGPSVREVEWAPAGGAPRPVPACAADALRVEQGLEPAAREFDVGGRRVPYWDAPVAYGPYAGGFFGGFGIFPALVFGSMLGSAFSGPYYDGG